MIYFRRLILLESLLNGYIKLKKYSFCLIFMGIQPKEIYLPTVKKKRYEAKNILKVIIVFIQVEYFQNS